MTLFEVPFCILCEYTQYRYILLTTLLYLSLKKKYHTGSLLVIVYNNMFDDVTCSTQLCNTSTHIKPMLIFYAHITATSFSENLPFRLKAKAA